MQGERLLALATSLVVLVWTYQEEPASVGPAWPEWPWLSPPRCSRPPGLPNLRKTSAYYFVRRYLLSLSLRLSLLLSSSHKANARSRSRSTPACLSCSDWGVAFSLSLPLSLPLSLSRRSLAPLSRLLLNFFLFFLLQISTFFFERESFEREKEREKRERSGKREKRERREREREE